MNILKQRGFGLIEVLVALAIMAVGLLAIGAFQSSLVSQSSENNNRAIAMALAQARIEVMRNYTDLALAEGDFDDAIPTRTTFGNDETITSLSAIFTRQEKVVASGDVKDITVQVSWVSAQGETETVEISTEIAWQSPSLSGDLDTSAATGPMVRSATGRAKLGKGQVTDAENSDSKITYTNGDGTGLLDRGDGDLRLTSGDDIVLTLEDACVIDDNNERTSEPCTGFVEISGTVYIDRNTSSVDVSDLFVIASDAAFCQRYIVENEGETSEKIIPITSETTKAFSTANSDYEYFSYTCYLGGGWHGNIGILVDGPVWACMGDPNALDASKQPKVAIRRVYRGMAFTDDGSGSPVNDSNGDPLYYSVGVADALVLPQGDDAGHDFVISDLSSSDDSACTTASRKSAAPMLLPDSNVDGELGDLFAGVPTDFVCLNQNSTWVDAVKMDAFGYTVNNYCPFDPSDPPSDVHVLSGVIEVIADVENLPKIKDIGVLTSDGYGNCTINSTTKVGTIYEVDYDCNVYDWGEGWSGYVQITPDLSIFECVTTSQTFSDIASNQDIPAFLCKDSSDIIIDPDPDPDPDPSPQTNVVVTGNLIKSGGGAFGSVSISDGFCVDNGSIYTCTSGDFDEKSSWSGTVTYVASKKNACLSAPNSEETIDSAMTESGNKATFKVSLVDDVTKSNVINVNFTYANSCN